MPRAPIQQEEFSQTSSSFANLNGPAKLKGKVTQGPQNLGVTNPVPRSPAAFTVGSLESTDGSLLKRKRSEHMIGDSTGHEQHGLLVQRLNKIEEGNRLGRSKTDKNDKPLGTLVGEYMEQRNQEMKKEVLLVSTEANKGLKTLNERLVQLEKRVADTEKDTSTFETFLRRVQKMGEFLDGRIDRVEEENRLLRTKTDEMSEELGHLRDRLAVMDNPVVEEKRYWWNKRDKSPLGYTFFTLVNEDGSLMEPLEEHTAAVNVTEDGIITAIPSIGPLADKSITLGVASEMGEDWLKLLGITNREDKWVLYRTADLSAYGLCSEAKNI